MTKIALLLLAGLRRIAVAAALIGFNDEQMQQFIQNWFRAAKDVENDTAEKCWELLNSDSHKAAKELGHTPLLLTFLCLVYDRTQGFPSKRAALYQRALDILLEEWAAEKRIQQEDVYRGLSTELEKLLLAEIAYRGLEQDRLFFSRQELVDQIKAFLADTVDKPKYLDGKGVLNAIVIQQGVLVERLDAVYSFSHLTLQEYLAALHISSQEKLMEEMVKNHLTQQQWREVFLLVAGLVSPNTDRLLKLMEVAAQQFISSPKLMKLMIWADEATEGSAGEFKPAAKRAGAIGLVLALDRALALALDLARDLALALDRARALALAENPELKRELQEVYDRLPDPNNYNQYKQWWEQQGKQWTEDLRQIMIKHRNIGHDWQFTNEQKQKLQQYHDANLLLAQCLKSECYLSREVREEIEETMLLPVAEIERWKRENGR
jgi:predicted NACHT family NTPase